MLDDPDVPESQRRLIAGLRRTQILAVLLIGEIAAFSMLVVPSLESVYRDLGAELPAATNVALAMHRWWAVAVLPCLWTLHRAGRLRRRIAGLDATQTADAEWRWHGISVAIVVAWFVVFFGVAWALFLPLVTLTYTCA